MEKQTFKVEDQKQNIFSYNGLKVQIMNCDGYSLAAAFKPSIYLYEFLNEKNEVVAKYVGKSYCGISNRFCDHLTHKESRVDRYIDEAKDKGYLIRIRCLAVCGSMTEMDETEKKCILELEKQEYNEITGEDTDYNSYRPFKEVFEGKILNMFLI